MDWADRIRNQLVYTKGSDESSSIVCVCFKMILFNNLNRCFRLNHTLTQYLVILGSLIFFYCLYSGGYHRLVSAGLLVNLASSGNDAADNRSTISVHPATSDNPDVEQPVIDRRTSAITTTISTTTRAATTTANHRLVSTTTIKRSFNSTCSLAADGRGPHQNVISYSMYGKNFSDPNFFDLYLKSFTEILASIPARYPGHLIINILINDVINRNGIPAF